MDSRLPKKERLMPRFARGLLGTALLGVGLQTLVLLAGHSRSEVNLLSNILSICLAVLATSAAVWAARTPESYAKWLWLLTASGFALLTAGELLRTFYDSVLHAPVHAVWPSDILYFLFPVPMAMALVLRVRPRRFQGIHWAQCLDFLQIGKYLERADSTSRILDLKYHILLPRGEEVGGNVDTVQWQAVLKSCSANEAYRKIHHPSQRQRRDEVVY